MGMMWWGITAIAPPSHHHHPTTNIEAIIVDVETFTKAIEIGSKSAK